jgi:hypothetical protein
MLLALAYAHVVLSKTEGDSHFGAAEHLLRRHQSTGRARPDLHPTQAAIRHRIDARPE